MNLADKLRVTKYSMIVERLLNAAFYPVMVVAAFIICALFNIKPSSTLLWYGWMFGWVFNFVVWSIIGIRSFKVPTEEEVRKRLDKQTAHRAVSAYYDLLDSKKFSYRNIWDKHKDQLIEDIKKVDPSGPKVDFTIFDPYVIRVVFVLLLVIGFTYAGPNSFTRIANAFTPSVNIEAPYTLVNAWIVPPKEYKVRPILLVNQNELIEANTTEIIKNSELIVRVIAPKHYPKFLVNGNVIKANLFTGNEIIEYKVLLEKTSFVELSLQDKVIAQWKLIIKNDEKPTISIEKDSLEVKDGKLFFRYLSEDDYGIAQTVVQFSFGEKVFNSTLPLPRYGLKKIQELGQINLSDHDLAGEEVLLTLFVKDTIGQQGQSETYTVTFPEKDPNEELKKEQQQLIDETYKESKEKESDEKKRKDLKERQEQLKEKTSNEEARKEMESASKNLEENNLDEALKDQSEALKALEEETQQRTNQNNSLNDGENKMGEEGKDPLDRPTNEDGKGEGGVDVPSQLDIERAREITDTIRDKMSNPNLSLQEKQYLERLLEQF